MERSDPPATPTSRSVPDETPWLDGVADVVTVSGPDAQSYLHSQLSQEVRDLAVGERRWTFLLEPTGKIDVLARLTRTEDETFTLETDPGFGQVMLARLDRFKIRVAAETSLVEGSGEVIDAAEAVRVTSGWPKMGAEIVPGQQLPAETGVTPFAVDFRKGCYPGQELVERMDSRGAEPPRTLRRFEVPAGTEPGAPIVDEAGAEVGMLTSVVGTSALGYVKRGSAAGEPIVHESAD